ncbi:anther-specific proline-rich protein APG [Hyposmocoma kahamanoa]|uniref:anther-specific proline-rich protein APG n=1 Tax=Hyposmocoma kahamanoa TaxID=1477025 RepID=UPI000E6D9AC6|nr:anther-specific proline-rich protein APG [Hyposmocoma kahamanoa]
MFFSARLQLLTCLVLYASCAQAIMVKFGTKGGPIEPPPPELPQPAPQPNRTPAPVWEERPSDTPDPNAQWRPQLFIPQPRYTQIVYNPQQPNPGPINNAQSFVNSYIPKHEPIQAKSITNYFTPSQILSSQALPGYGLRYFIPTYLSNLLPRKEQLQPEDAKINQIETNDVQSDVKDSTHDLQWKYEKDATKRNIRHISQPTPYPYKWPQYVARQQ